LATSSRTRADRLLVERGLFESRAKAQAAIEAGLVTADSTPVRKASDAIARNAKIEAEPAHPWVSRAGVKLAHALDALAFDVSGRVCLDVGASTGGFTQVLLARGAARVYAVDVGSGQLHARLRQDARVVSLEQTDIRTLDANRLDPRPDIVTIDVSFISLKAVLPAALALAARPLRLVALVKPQFEVGRAHLKKGIVRDETQRAAACDAIVACLSGLGATIVAILPSPIRGGDGNVEFLIGATLD
jgi:23S rRNA (cytidine1920-2'-O)/16S rRNA (cytidine1409-2'-O)-methyltransferase